MARPVPVLILFGVPGAGKGTFATLLAGRFGFAHLSTGAAMRTWSEGPSAEQRALKASLAQGGYGSNELAATIVAETIAGLPAGTPAVILDGFPRNIEQLRSWLALGGTGTAVEVVIDDATAKARIATRGTCERDGTSTRRVGQACPLCGRPTGRRADDVDPAVAELRLAKYQAWVGPVLAHWRKTGRAIIRVENTNDRQLSAAAPEVVRAVAPAALAGR